MMKPQFFHVTLEKCHYRNVAPTGMARLIASDLVFFCDLEAFENSLKLFESLESGDQLQIGAHQLIDGSYWIHWIYHKTKGRIEPDRTLSFNRKIKMHYALGIINLIIFAASFFVINYSDSFLFILLIIVCACIAFTGICYLFSALYKSWILIHPGRRRLLNALDKIINSQYKIDPNSISLIIPGIKNPPLKKQKRVNTALLAPKLDDNILINPTDLVRKIQTSQYVISTHRSSYEVNTTSFFTRAKSFVISTRNNTQVLVPQPIQRRSHPLFIAASDPVEVIYTKNSKEPLHPRVLGIFNHQDKQAYLTLTHGYPTEKTVYKTLSLLSIAIVLFYIMVVIGHSISTVYERGNYWDRWDWLDFINFMPSMLSMIATIMLAIFFIIGLLTAIYYRASTISRYSYQSYYYLRYLRRKAAKSDYIMELHS